MANSNKSPLYSLVQLGVSRQEIADYLDCDRKQVDRYFAMRNSRNLSSSRYLLLIQLLRSKL